MNYRDRISLLYREKGKYIAILNENYRLDGSMIIEGDSMDSVVADIMRADRWVTINGSHVLINDKTGKILAGMGSKFNGFSFGAKFADRGNTTKSGKKVARLYKVQHARKIVKSTDETLYNRDKLGEIAKKCERFKKSAEYGNMQLGIRVQMADTETLGKVMKHKSKNFGFDFETKEELRKRNGEQFDGVSTIGIDLVHEVDRFGGYNGKIAYLVAGEKASDGYDAGEKVIKSPKVLAKFGFKDGNLVELESVKTTLPKKVKTAKPTKPSDEYTSFISQMEKKYGKEGMYSAMTDAEFDKYQYLENHKYDYFYKNG